MLVCNHVSFADAVVLMAASPRPVRFVMDHRIFKVPLLSWFFRQAGAIAIAPAHEDGTLLARAYDRIAAALAEGDLVCIFPEGKITADGELNPFKQGVMQIIGRTPVPVVPMALRGLWGSFFARKGGAAMSRPFRRGILSRLELVVGEPIAPEAVTPEGLRRGARPARRLALSVVPDVVPGCPVRSGAVFIFPEQVAMIVLYTFGPAFGLPDASPFVTKADMLLKLAGLPYRSERGSLRRAPGKLPHRTTAAASWRIRR